MMRQDLKYLERGCESGNSNIQSGGKSMFAKEKIYGCNNQLELLPANRYICDAFSKVSKIKPKKYIFSIPEEIGQGGFRQISTRNNIIISEFQMCYKCNMDVMGTSNPLNIDICFCLGEGVSWKAQNEYQCFEINKGETFISNNRHGLERICYCKDCDFNFIGIKIPINRFKKIVSEYVSTTEEMTIEETINLFSKYTITPSIRIILQQLLNCPYKNAMQEMYIEGKLLELLSVYFSEIVLQRNTLLDSSIELSRTDKESIFKAKEILDKNISSPPSCDGLARMVYLSESKLTKGFKAILGMTVHTYVIDKRMETALYLFENGETQVSRVADMVGYGNRSHFSVAFKKKYGINPREYIKNI